MGSYLFLFFEFIIFARLIFYASSKSQKLPFDGKFCTSPFRWVAIGCVFAFFPVPAGTLNALFGYVVGEYTILPLFTIQAIGAFLMFVGFMKGYKMFRYTDAGKSGFLLGIIGSIVGIIANLFTGYTHRLGLDSILPDTQIFIVSTVLITMAFFQLKKKFTRFSPLAITSSMLVLAMVCGYVSWEADASVGYMVDLYNAVFYNCIPTWIMAMILFIMSIFGCRVTKSVPRVIIHVNSPASNIEYQPVAEPQSKTSNASTPSPIPAQEDILQKLKGYDDARLRKIVDNPKFHSVAVVDKARELLARREAWEQIKDLPDEELLEMTMADKGLYELNIVEAASMELYQRDSRLLREQFMALTPDTLSAIASGTAPAPEGIRLAAQKYLSKSTRP